MPQLRQKSSRISLNSTDELSRAFSGIPMFVMMLFVVFYVCIEVIKVNKMEKRNGAFIRLRVAIIIYRNLLLNKSEEEKKTVN